MIEIKCAGRGGQGAVVFSELLAKAAFCDGCQVQAMPTFGVERRGAPSYSFTRVSKKQINLRQQIYDPNILVVLDSSLLSKELVNTVKKGGLILINSTKKCHFSGYKTYCTDASEIALDILKKNIVNTAMLGAIASATDLVSIESVLKAIKEKFENNKDLMEKNLKAVKEVYQACQKDKCKIKHHCPWEQ